MVRLPKSQELWDVESRAFLITVALYGLILVIGLVGNGIVVALIIFLRRRGQTSSVQLFLLHLAISDLMVCLLCVPLTIFSNFHYPNEYHARDNGLCKLARFMQNLGPVISVSLLTVISIDRYLKFVRQELSSVQRIWYLRPSWLTLFAWVYGTSQNLPVFHSADVVPIEYKNHTIYYCTTTQSKTISGRIYLSVSVLLGFFIPFTAMTISYYRVIRVVWTRKRRLPASLDPESNATITNEKLLERTGRKVLRVLLTVVICFVICWLPFTLYHGILERYLKEFPNPMDEVRLITYGVGLANSTCNPFIYYFNIGGKSFRSIKRRFVEAMGDRARTSSHSVMRSQNLARSVRQCEVSTRIVELDFPKKSSVSPTCPNADDTLDSNSVTFAYINDISGSQEDDMTFNTRF